MGLSVTRSSVSRRLVAALLAATCSITAAAPVLAANNDIKPNGSAAAGGTGGFAGAHGHHDLNSGLASGTVSNASNDANHSQSSSNTGGVAGANQGHHGHGSFVHVATNAGASAYADANTLHAHAYAGSGGVAGAASGHGKVLVKTDNNSEADALRVGNTATAWAASSAGGYAGATTNGRTFGTSAFVPDGTSRTFDTGRMDYTIAWNKDGSFSLAEATRRSAFAETGTVSNTGAFASGNLGAILNAATFAEAFVGGNTAWASASASIFGASGNGHGNTYAGLESSAFATASYSPPPLAQSNSNLCELAHDWKKQPMKPDLKKHWNDECLGWRHILPQQPSVGHS